MTQIFLYDTTLRDGTQGEGFSLSCNDKLKIAKKPDFLKVWKFVPMYFSKYELPNT